MLVDQTVRDILAAFSAPDPTPGGGSASALASALGVSLLMMVAGLAKTRNGSDDDRAALAAASAALAAIRDELTTAIDTDTAAYDQVVNAYKLPKATSDEQEARKAAIQRALRTATDMPLSVMRLSAAALGQRQRPSGLWQPVSRQRRRRGDRAAERRASRRAAQRGNQPRESERIRISLNGFAGM